MAHTARVKYVYLDVVGFSSGRSVEAQADIVKALNECVLSAVEATEIPKEHTVFIPTGDGMCIALVGVADPFDVHVDLALRILELIAAHNERVTDTKRQFQVRIGINENVDNVVKDINGRRNLAGAGINGASRIMGLADGGQILLSASEYEMLRHREDYTNRLRGPYDAVVKHNTSITVFQLVGDYPGLNALQPRTFQSGQIARLSTEVAWYLLEAIVQRRKLIEVDEYDSSIIWLWYRAQDSLAKATAKEHEKPLLKIYGQGTYSPNDEFAHYQALDYSVKSDFATHIRFTKLSPFSDCFERSGFFEDYRYVNQKGQQKLKDEFPDLWRKIAVGLFENGSDGGGYPSEEYPSDE